jgi:phosphoglycolate phosphatase-like HAD superfamily hydrolase
MLTVPAKIYEAFFFDLDGVLLDTNAIKHRNIRRACDFLGKGTADDFAEYFISRNGVTRERKINDWFSGAEAGRILERYNRLNAITLAQSSLLPGAEQLLDGLRTRGIPAHIFTGGTESEAIPLCQTMGLLDMVVGVHGGPADKSDNMGLLDPRGRIIYFGDSHYDYEVAAARGYDFVFVAGVTQFSEWKIFFDKTEILGVVQYLDEVQLS